MIASFVSRCRALLELCLSHSTSQFYKNYSRSAGISNRFIIENLSAEMEPFTFIESTVGSNTPFNLFDENVRLTSAKNADHDLQYIKALRKAFPELIVTACPSNNAPLRAFAAAGNAFCERDTKTDSFASWRGYSPPAKRSDSGSLAEAVSFAKWHYKWNQNDYVLYTIGGVQYILVERRGDEEQVGPSKITDDLIRTVGDWMNTIEDVVWVYDDWWTQDRDLWKEVQKASWDNVILDESVKDELTSVAHHFFDSEDTYRELGVPWKRGLMFHGPPGNGKTISIRALMHSLYNRKKPIPTLYVRNAPLTYDIGQVFSLARRQSPCMLVLEDVETIVTSSTRSYFFNEMDGLANNDGLFIVASTNFLDKLDPGLSRRPSRFDRKYLFPIPNEHERTLYCEFWRQKVRRHENWGLPCPLCDCHWNTTFANFWSSVFVATV